MKLKIPRFIFLLLFAPLLMLCSCRDNSGDGIPSYLRINEIKLTVSPGQGTASHKITDAWMYIGDELIGAFELPATFPVLKTGRQNITIQAGIKINGIAATRAPYPFYNPITVQVDLTAGSVTEIASLTTTYKSKTIFAWIEDFDGNSISVDTTRNSNNKLRKTSHPNLMFSYPGETNRFSAMASLSGDTILFECASLRQFVLPAGENPIFAELNYKANNTLTIGVFAHTSQQVSQKSILVLNPTESWNKVYVNLTPTVQTTANAIGYKVFIGFMRDKDITNAQVFFDNIKLVYL